jgi:hypothetical protein
MTRDEKCGIRLYPQPPAWNGIPWIHDVFAGANATKAYIIAEYRGLPKVKCVLNTTFTARLDERRRTQAFGAGEKTASPWNPDKDEWRKQTGTRRRRFLGRTFQL